MLHPLEGECLRGLFYRTLNQILSPSNAIK